MSAQLQKQASSHAGFLGVVTRLFHTIPPIPSDITLVGKTALVTGSNVGLGLECCRDFLKLRPARLIMAVRSVKKGEAAAQKLRADFPGTKIEVWQIDLASYASVQAFAAQCDRELDRLDVAVLNAGFGAAKFQRAEEGRHRELVLQVNYLSTALLAILLLPKLKPTVGSPDPGRLTIVSSDAALGVKLKGPTDGGILNSLDRPEKFSAFPQYSFSKLLLTMFTAKLAEAVDPSEIIINSCNPSATKGTGFLVNVDSGLVKTLIGAWMNLMGRKTEEAARTYVFSSLVLGKESHGSFTDWEIRAWPVTMYGESGTRLMNQLWDETLDELSFAGVDGILKEIKH